MSRGNPHYMKLDIDALRGEKISQLTIHELHTYIWGCWRLSVWCRSDHLTVDRVTSLLLPNYCRTSNRRLPVHLTKLHNLGLISIHSNGAITVYGVMARHGKLRWNESVPDVLYGVLPVPCTVDQWYPVQPIARQHDSTTAREKNISITNLPLRSESIVDNSDLDSEGGIDPDSKPERYLTGDKLESTVRDIVRDLCLTDTIANRVSIYDMFRNNPARLVMDAFLQTSDRQESDKCGTSESPLQNPIGYMVELLRKELRT